LSGAVTISEVIGVGPMTPWLDERGVCVEVGLALL